MSYWKLAEEVNIGCRPTKEAKYELTFQKSLRF